MKTSVLIATVVTAAILGIGGYALATTSTNEPTVTEPAVALNGAGATFPYPLIDKWRYEYRAVKPNVTVNYQSIGSGGGIKAITDKTVDFGASDAPLSDEEFNQLPGILHIPETIGAVAVIYNIPDVSSGLRLTGDVLSQIFIGEITSWNDPQITTLNPSLGLPNEQILVAHRSDGSGTTFVFTDYLSTVSQEWATAVGTGKSVSWPTGIGGKGNEGVAGVVKQNQFSIGYVELAYAKLEGLTYAWMRNRAGSFIEPSLESTGAAAAAAALSLPEGNQSWTGVSIVDPSGADPYPIASFTYILVYTNQTDRDKGKALVDFLWWVVHDGQQYSAGLDYVPLPDEVVELNEKTLEMVNYSGEPFIQ